MPSALIVPLLGLALVVLLLLLLFPGYLWQRTHNSLQQSLTRSVEQFRLSKMLAFLGIKIRDYVHHVPEQVIVQHIARCEACPNTRECDSCLRDGRFFADMNFCPNFRSLMHCSRMMPVTSQK